MTSNVDFGPLVDAFLTATNAFDADAALTLFITDAVIDDPSTGVVFDGQAGVREYVKRFFVGYHTVSVLLSVTPLDNGRVRARVDFTGDFGHEIGRLDLTVTDDGLIARIDADLE